MSSQSLRPLSLYFATWWLTTVLFPWLSDCNCDSNSLTTHFHFRLLISSEGPSNLEKENRVISTWHTIYRTEAVWMARSCRCLPHLRTPCHRAWGSPAARQRPPASVWRHGAPSWLGDPAGAPTGRLHLMHRWWAQGGTWWGVIGVKKQGEILIHFRKLSFCLKLYF